MISDMCFQVNFCLWSCRICYRRGKIVSSFGLRNVYIFTLKVGSFSLLFTCCRVLVMAAMLVVNGFLLHHLLPFLFFSLPVKLTEFNFFLAFFQGVSLDTISSSFYY